MPGCGCRASADQAHGGARPVRRPGQLVRHFARYYDPVSTGHPGRIKVAVQSRGFALDLMALPTQSDELGVVFALGTGNNGRPLLLLFPQQGPGLMPHVRYAAYMSLRLGDGTL